MSNRDFNEWQAKFEESISDYKYYVDFSKIYKNIDEIKVELNIMNSLIGSRDIKSDFIKLVQKYPEILKCIPILLAKREFDIYARDGNGTFNYDFLKLNQTIEQYCYFMEMTGLFDLISKHIISNLIDYVTGVEVGLDSNGRKNRGGHIMENLVESYIIKAGFIKGETYFTQMYIKEIAEKWGIDLSAISNNDKAEKRFDFVIKTKDKIYGIETNFYSSSGSKLNETARSYKMLAEESKNIDGFEFIWITDGRGWKSARNNLLETFESSPNIYNLSDLEQGILKQLD